MKWIKELRVTHYLKNALVFVPVFFSGAGMSFACLKTILISFICFCMGASAIYLMNDIKDVEKDRMHPVKRYRPLATGEISVYAARCVSIGLVVFAFLLLFLFRIEINGIAVFSFYLLINYLYSVRGWKHVPLIDVSILVLGFYLRVLMGAVVVHIEISPWLSLVIITGAGFLAFGKRRNEQKVMGDETRKVLRAYPAGFLDKAMYACMVMTNIFFALWCVLEKTKYYLLLFPLVMLLCFRYCMDLEQEQNQGDPMDVILEDKVLFAIGASAGVIMLCLLYILRV